ncbi:MAG TPA: MarR family winged helix-turn-helix transcriptional regulator [Planctomycetota bacterium]|nr:MarR family winged helix-turn-helix transcriptional regulator [Planctomycetota bacterium]
MECILEREKCAEIALHCACFNFRKASRAVTQLFDATLAPSGMRSTQFTVLIGLGLVESATVSELAEMLAIDRTTMSRTLKPLLKKGYIGPVSGADRRTRAVALQKKGRQTLASMLPLWERAQAQVVGKFGSDRWSALRGDLDAAVLLAKEK